MMLNLDPGTCKYGVGGFVDIAKSPGIASIAIVVKKEYFGDICVFYKRIFIYDEGGGDSENQQFHHFPLLATTQSGYREIAEGLHLLLPSPRASLSGLTTV